MPRRSELSTEGLAAIGAQPHGYLLVLDPQSQRILAASANLLERHVAQADILGATADLILGADIAHRLRAPEALAATPQETLPERVRCAGLGDEVFDMVSHLRGGRQIVELESSLETPDSESRDFLQGQYATGKALYQADTVERLCEVAVTEIKRLSGYDRVMIYRFDADAHGEIVAEALNPGDPPFLGLHYPASDIPRQARLLYLRNGIRVIPDSSYAPLPIVMASGAGAADEIDLSLSALRSVSPYHLQYLQNMGVAATMTISLIIDNQLWGMLACHHGAPKRISHLQRVGFELLGQQLSVRLRAAEAAGFQERAQGLGRLSAQVVAAMAAAEDVASGAASARDALIGMVDADGVVVSIDGRHIHLGATPEPEALAPLIEAFAERAGAASEPWSTDNLPGVEGLPVACGPELVAATGVLYLPLAGYGRNFVLWLRGERAATIRWAGRQEAAKEDALTPLQPRASFAEWLQLVRGRSLPWRAEEIAVASEFGQAMPEVFAHRAQNRLMKLALHDALTGLPNRIHLMDRLEKMLAAASGAGSAERSRVGVLFLDLDGFKSINDTMGHDAGDETLRYVARRLKELVRSQDFVARIGGDEFVVIVAETNARETALIAERFVEAMRHPFMLKSHLGRFVTLSVGATVVDRGAGPGEALAQADAAMYHAKRSGRDQAAVYDASAGAAVNRRQVASDELKAAIAAGEILPFFQAVYEFGGAGEPVLHGFEALARWRHPTRGLVSPGEFIALAEECDLIGPLGRSMLRQSLEALRGWPDARLAVAVNVSAQQLLSDGFADETLNELLELGLPPTRLCLEITESVMMHSPERCLAALHRLSEAGVSIAIDDFGAGFSSLAYVRNLPAAILKIDRSFVAGLPDDPKDRAVVKATIELAHALGMKIVAEGVETAAQLEHLRRVGADYVQGYLLARPQPAESLEFGSATATASAA